MAIVLSHAKRLTGDEDAAADATLYVIQNLHRFVRQKANSFSHWIFSICRRRRLESYRRRDHEEFIDETYPSDEGEYRDYSLLSPSLRSIAQDLASGKTIDELAAKEGVEPASIRRRILRQCVT